MKTTMAKTKTTLPPGFGKVLKRLHYPFEKAFRRHKQPVGKSWRMDETYIKVGGHWKYLYRAMDKAGNTVGFVADHNHAVIRVQVDSAKLVHAGLLWRQVGLAPQLYACAVSSRRREAGYMIITTAAPAAPVASGRF
jgi:hypothetical protein